MALETDADLATFFDDDEHGTAATFTPAAGPAVACTVVVDTPQSAVGAGLAGMAEYNRSLRVRVSEVSDPRGGAFALTLPVVGAVTLTCAEADLDDTGKIWTAYLKP